MITVRSIVYSVETDEYQFQVVSSPHLAYMNWGIDCDYAEQLLTDNLHTILDLKEKIYYQFPFGMVKPTKYLDDILLAFGDVPVVPPPPYTKVR